MKKISLFCISLLFLSAANAQNDTAAYAQIKKLALKADQLPYSSDTFKLELDSMNVDIRFNKKKIHTESYFLKSRRKITIDYYTINHEPTYIRLTENACISHYYSDRGQFSKVERSRAGKTDKKHQPSCMDAANLAFLDQYIMKLYFHIYARQAPAKQEIVMPD